MVYVKKGTLGSSFGSANSFGPVQHSVFKIKTQTQSYWCGIRLCPQERDPMILLHYATSRSSDISIQYKNVSDLPFEY
jgi:hypothetical protein